VISIKRYLDGAGQPAPEPQAESSDLRDAAIECYRALLRAVGKSAVRACQAPGANLEQQLARFEGSLSRRSTARSVEEIQLQVEDRLERWGQLTAEHLKTKADEVKELMILLSGTAESFGERDHRYTLQFGDLTVDLRAIAHLDDVTQIRASVVRKATELKSCVDRMAQESQQSLSEMRTRLKAYETRLQVVEQLAMKDTLTGLANRRNAQARMEWYVSQRQTFSVAVVDLDSFKSVNDKLGHAAGDDLLRRFGDELHKTMRFTDLVARWGGDEFVVVLDCDLAAGQRQVERIRGSVLGRYRIQSASKKSTEVHVEASIGLAQWVEGKTAGQVMEEADAAMYHDKKRIASVRS
jgi:diguanylate cyclase (GGDEF)-like protein